MERPCREAGSFFNEAGAIQGRMNAASAGCAGAALVRHFILTLLPARYRFTRNPPEYQEPAASQAAQVFPGRTMTRHADSERTPLMIFRLFSGTVF